MRPDGVEPLVAAADREQVAVRDARVEPHVVAAQPPLEEVDQFGRFGRGDMAGRMVADALLLDRNEVAAHDHFAAPDFDAHAGRFERTASFEDGGNVVPQQRGGVRFRCPGANPSGTVSRIPEAPSAAMRSIVGLRAACSGVRPPSRGIGSSAIPSPRMMRYFMVYRILAMRMMSAKTPAAVTSAPAPYPLSGSGICGSVRW